jgi:tryptophan-rich sensory protein
VNPWLESIAVTLLAIAGVVLGRWFGRLPKPYWLFGYFIPLVLIVLYALGNALSCVLHHPSRLVDDDGAQ